MFIRNVIRVNIVIIIPLLSPAVYKILPNIVLYNVTPYVEKVIGNYRLDCDVSITKDHILCTGEIVGVDCKM
jgi:hypothetical protein